jgi:hypothetical protein
VVMVFATKELKINVIARPIVVTKKRNAKIMKMSVAKRSLNNNKKAETSTIRIKNAGSNVLPRALNSIINP